MQNYCPIDPTQRTDIFSVKTIQSWAGELYYIISLGDLPLM